MQDSDVIENVEAVSSKTFSTEVDFVVEREVLMKSLSHVQSIVEKRNIIPILSNVKLSVKAGQVELTSTDMDICVSETIEAEVKSFGDITIPAQTFYEVIRKLPPNVRVKIAASEETYGKVEISAGDCNFSLSFLRADDFPSMDKGVMEHNFILQNSEFKRIIDKNRFAISTEETRYNLNGIYMHIVEDAGVKVLRAVATDGHRLACVATHIPDGAESIPGVIIPRKAITEFRKILEDTDKDITVSLSSNKIQFRVGKIMLITKLIDGIFPEYEALIPKGNSSVMSVSKSAFNESVDRVTAVAVEKSRLVKMHMNGGEMILSVVSEDQSTAQEKISISSNVTDLSIGFNSRYLLDVMSVLDGAEVEFTFSDPFSPSLIKDKSDDSACFVVMPMRV